MIGLYQGEGFLSSLVLHNDNMTDLIQSVREKYGQEMSNLQVLTKVQVDIREMEQKNCSICDRIFGG
jgi:hypothetical protein